MLIYASLCNPLCLLFAKLCFQKLHCPVRWYKNFVFQKRKQDALLALFLIVGAQNVCLLPFDFLFSDKSIMLKIILLLFIINPGWILFNGRMNFLNSLLQYLTAVTWNIMVVATICAIISISGIAQGECGTVVGTLVLRFALLSNLDRPSSSITCFFQPCARLRTPLLVRPHLLSIRLKSCEVLQNHRRHLPPCYQDL